MTGGPLLRAFFDADLPCDQGAAGGAWTLQLTAIDTVSCFANPAGTALLAHGGAASLAGMVTYVGISCEP